MQNQKINLGYLRVLWILFIFSLCNSNLLLTAAVIRTRLPSETAGQEGLAIRIDMPPFMRYDTGAPVVIYMAGGFQSEGLDERSTGLDTLGFIEIRFNFPGGGSKDDISGGIYDNRGFFSLKAARDVLQFANNILSDSSGRTLSEITSPIVPLATNIGLVGWSYGGVTNICLAGIHGSEIPNLAWIVNWESPVGDGMPQAEAGDKADNLRPWNPSVNPAYNPDTGEWDLTHLAYSDTITIPILENQQQSVKGGFYFDFNENGIVDHETDNLDFVPYPLVFDTPQGLQAYYSERIRRETKKRNLYPSIPPDHIPTLEETEAFWLIRNGEYWIMASLEKHPDLMFMIVASDTDHVQRTPDHPHVLNQYEKYRLAGARFVRLNPDKTYIDNLTNYAYPNVVDNDAFIELDHMNIRDKIEPGEATKPLGYSIIAAAGACELADRTQTNNLDLQLDYIISNVNQIPVNPPEYQLLQNYPNPFNHSTLIRFRLEKPSHTELIVYNLLGCQITKLINTIYPAGNHEIHFNGSDLPSGVYIYHIRTDDFQWVQKMTLSK
jgi:hypothetical protein